MGTKGTNMFIWESLMIFVPINQILYALLVCRLENLPTLPYNRKLGDLWYTFMTHHLLMNNGYKYVYLEVIDDIYTHKFDVIYFISLSFQRSPNFVL